MNIFLRIGKWIESWEQNRRFKTLQLNSITSPGTSVKEYFYTWEVNIDPSQWTWTIGNTILPRLRFHVGKARVQIIIGNPVTYCIWEDDQFVLAGVSLCNPKDKYDWRRGAIVALQNTVSTNLTKDAVKELFAAMFKKYPELRIK